MVGLDNLAITFIEFAGGDRIVAVKLLFFANFGLVKIQYGLCLNDFPVFVILQALDIAGRAVGKRPVQAGR